MASVKRRRTALKQPQQARSRATLEAIVAAANRVFAADGCEAGTIARIAQVAGVSAGSLYQYFPTKEALVSAVMEAHCGKMISFLEPRLLALAGLPVREGAGAAMRLLIEAYTLDAALMRTLLGDARLAGESQVARHFDGRLRGALQVYLEAHRPSLAIESPERAVRILVPAVQGAIRDALVTDSPLFASGELAEELSRLVIGYLRA
jgi:AcrR family transcriptional regulator